MALITRSGKITFDPLMPVVVEYDAEPMMINDEKVVELQNQAIDEQVIEHLPSLTEKEANAKKGKEKEVP